jgi:hypothetical protein
MVVPVGGAPRRADVGVALRLQLERQVSHWDAAALALEDPSSFASPVAWQLLESYLDRAVRRSLAVATAGLRSEITGVRAQLTSSSSPSELMAVARRVQQVRRRYGQVEAVISFFTDAVNTRTSPTLGTHLRALDRLATASMATTLVPLGRPVPPVLTFVDKGLGAAIVRAGVRLWDGQLSPAAAIKVTRHNLYRPSSLVHETGHQVAHLLGWNHEARRQLGRTLADDPELAAIWMSWTSEITADAYAFVHCGYAAVAALHDVVASEIESVLHLSPGDPHPVSYIRVLLGVEMCRSQYGRGPWDQLGAAWRATHPLSSARPAVRAVLARSVTRLPGIVDALLAQPAACFGERSLVDVVDPARVSPASLDRLARDHGDALLTSPMLVVDEGLRVVALTGYRIATEPAATARHAGDFARFAQRLGSSAHRDTHAPIPSVVTSSTTARVA